MNTQKRLWLILVLVFTGFIHPPYAYLYGDVYLHKDGTKCEYKFLPIEIIGQEKNNWCGFASGEMIMKALSKKEVHVTVRQCEQARPKIGRRGDCCESRGLKGCGGFGWPQYHIGKFKPKNKRGVPLKWLTLVEQIEMCKPVGFSWKWLQGSRKKAKGHYMVARGYIKLMGVKMVVVNDPSPWHPEKSKGGSIKIMNYQDYVGFDSYYKSWRTHYDLPSIKECQKDVPILPCNRSIFPYKQGEKNPTIQDPELIAARNKSHKLLKHLPLNIKKLLCFESERMVEKSKLGKKPWVVHVVTLNSLKNNNADINPDEILGKPYKEVTYPVVVDRKIVTLITLRKRNGKWTFAMFMGVQKYVNISPPASIRPLARNEMNRDNDKFIVEIPALYLVFRGFYSGKDLYLIPTHKHPEIDFEVDKPLPAKDVFKQLSKFLREDKNIPTHLLHDNQ